MKDTWTLAPYMSRWNYSENEKIVLNHYFTNIDKNIYCATDNMSSQLWAFLIGQYSRTHVALRDRFLDLFQNQKQALENWKIDQKDYISIDNLAQAIKTSDHNQIDFFEQKASNFLKKRGVNYGHDSLKDTDNVRIAIEWVSQTATKILEAPFPPLGNFQEKSTRYIPFSKESLIIPDQVKNSKNGQKIIDFNHQAIDLYNKYKKQVKEQLDKNNIIDRSSCSSEKVYQKTLQAKTFDIVRYLLPVNIATSLWASFSTRILETHLSYMLSHPLEEIRTIAQTMHQEALKITPWLLKHVSENQYQKTKRQKTSNTVSNIKEIQKYEPTIQKWLSENQRVNIIFDWDLDTHITASIIFYNNTKWLSYKKSLQIAQDMNNSEKEDIMKAELKDRWKYDRMPRSIQHSSIMFEYKLDFGAYRDIQRHRASKQLRTWPTWIHGYDYPEHIDKDCLKDFKKDYNQLMNSISKFAQNINNESPCIWQYLPCLGHLVQTTFEMHPGQLAYVIELRTKPQGHHSYRNLFIETYRQLQKKAPIFSRYIRCYDQDKCSRASQESNIEKKKNSN